MIICHSGQWIFIKGQRTAGSSIQYALQKYCKQGDIITKMWEMPNNYQVRESRTIKFISHDGANKIKSHVGEKRWQKYFKFTFDRNPWEKVVSLYCYLRKLKRIESSCPFDRYIRTTKPSALALNIPRYSLDSKIAVDFIGRYENLVLDFEYVCKKIKITPIPNLQILKQTNKSKYGPRRYQDWYSNETKEIIDKIFTDEIEYFGYKF